MNNSSKWLSKKSFWGYVMKVDICNKSCKRAYFSTVKSHGTMHIQFNFVLMTVLYIFMWSSQLSITDMVKVRISAVSFPGWLFASQHCIERIRICSIFLWIELWFSGIDGCLITCSNKTSSNRSQGCFGNCCVQWICSLCTCTVTVPKMISCAVRMPLRVRFLLHCF